jgi:hypothetical protein
MGLTTLAHGIGKGLVAGFAGTVAMTVSSTIEQKLRGREASSAPARAAEKALGIDRFEDRAAEQRFSNLVHWGYGTGWGAVRGVLRATGASPGVATAGHFAAIWGGSLVTLPMLDVAPPVTMWGKTDVAIDVWHHLVYTVATGVAYEALDSGDGGR